MAKILNKDPVTYQRERDGFIRDLQHFHETRGTPFRKVPKINGREIDLYLLYVLVTAHGGWMKVNSRNEWESLVDHFCLPKHCANCGVGLKQIYLRYLDRYEKVHYLGEDVDRGSDDDEESRHRRWSARALHSVPLTYNHHQHNVADTLRNYNGLSADLYKASEYDRLALSLISPLPNEQDFAINVCTLLSNEGKHTLKLDKYPRLVDFLLSHAGVFNHSSMRELFEEVYGNMRKHSLRHFWSDALADLDLCDLADETLFPTKKSKVREVICEAGGKAGLAGANCISDRLSRSNSRCSDRFVVKNGGDGYVMEKMDLDILSNRTEEEREGMVDSATSMEVDAVDLFVDTCATETVERTDIARPECYEEGEDGLLCDMDLKENSKTESRLKVPLKIESADLELFCLGRSFGTQDYIGQRVLQVATILRNLSFVEENVIVLARNMTFLRFVLLCAGSRWNCLHQLGLDMLGNVAHEVMMEDPTTDRLAACMLNSLTHGLHSQDRLVILSCLEVLNKLSQKDENEDIMLRYLDQRVYDQVCTFLTLHDIMLLIYTLECLYSLSSLGERACNCIVRVHGAIDTLVALITVEAQSYGPKACILMRVVETVSGTQAGSATSTTTTATALTTGTPNPNPPVPAVSTPVRPPAATTPHRQPTPQRLVIGAPQPAVATPVTMTLAQTPQQYQQQQHAHQQAAQENEQFALAWLRATFEPATGCRIEQAELYKQYLTACAKIGRRGVIAPLHFPRCVRSVFGGTVGPNPQKHSNVISGSGDQPGTNSQMFYEGIKVRANPFSIPVSVSGILQQPPSPQPAQQSLAPSVPVQRKGLNIVTKTVTPPPLTTSPAPLTTSESSATSGDASLPIAPAPASPILKAQLSAPPKQRDNPKGDTKSQVLAHPHLTQALLGSSGGSPSPTTGGKALAGSNKEVAGGGPPTSLIKSLLATKVNAAGSECMMPQSATVAGSSMMPAACSTTTTTTASTSTKQPPTTPQVTQRQQQQRLLQQQLQSQKTDSSSPPPLLPPSTSNNIQGKGVTNIINKNKPTTAAVAATTTTTVKAPDSRQRASRINGARTPLQVQSQTTPLQAQTPTQIEPLRDATGDSSNNGSCSMTTNITITTMTTTTTQCVASAGVITQVAARTITENHIPSPALAVGGGNLALRGRREPPQPPPPPLAPLSNSCLPSRLDIEDSDSTGNNSLASSSRDCSGTGAGNISSTDDGENSLTSFEGLLLNGIPHSLDIDAASNDSSSKDSARSSLQQQNPKPPGTKSLMLADLLEKKVDKKDPPILNGVLGKELRIGDKGLELVENHLEKVLKESSITQTKPVDVKEPSKNTGGISDICSESVGVVRTVGQVSNNLTSVSTTEKGNTAFKTVGIGTTDEPLMSNSVMTSSEQVKYGVITQQTQTVQALKRPSSESLGTEDGIVEMKRPHLSPESAMNGTASPGPITTVMDQNRAPLSPGLTDKSTSSSASNDNTEIVNASPSAANLYAALAASALEDEPDLELPPPPPTQVLVQSASGLRQAVFLGQGVESGSQQQLIVTAAPRQIIVSQGQLAPQGQVLITAGGQIALQQGPNPATATIKTPAGHQTVPVLVQTGSSAAQRAQISAVTHSQGPQLVQAGQVVLSQSSSGQFILSQAPAQGQVQLVQAGSGQASQYIIPASSGCGSGQTHYVVAQPQTALVQGQTQTVLVAQTPQQQGTGTKTIIILQPQSSSATTHHQKVVVTPQGQPVVVTQVPRPILQSPAISNPPPASIPPPALVPTSNAPVPPPPAPVSPAPQSVKHVSTVTVATSTNTAPVHVPSRVASTGTSTSLPPSQPQTRAITPTNSSTTTLSPASPSPVTAMKASAKPTAVHPTAVPSVPRPPLSPSPTTLNSPRATPVQPPKQTRTLPNTRPQSSSTPVNETNLDKSSLQTPVRSTKSPCQPAGPQTRLTTVGAIADQAIFLCEWRGCMRSFKSANEVYMHACEAHCPLGSEEIQCLWERCDAMKRKRFSLMTHLYDRHCNADVLRMMAVRRRQLSQSGRSEIPPPQPPPPHPGYAPNAAFHAIKRHALEFVNPKEMMRPAKPGPPATIPARTGPSPPEQDDNEGPVTKSIRLTSSLILRNLVIYSTNGRRFLRSYEPHLASVALSNVESSRTIAQVLYDMNQQTSSR